MCVCVFLALVRGLGFRRDSGLQVRKFLFGVLLGFTASPVVSVFCCVLFLNLYGTVKGKVGELMKEPENQSYDPGK